MRDEATHEIIFGFINNLLSASPGVFLVELKVSPLNDVKVFIDDDNGITIQKCAEVNRALYKFLEEKEIFPGNNFSLEVSSPGIEEPLRLHRQYVKNTGRKIEVEMMDGNKISAKLLSVTEDEITIEEATGKGKKQIIKKTTIFFNQIKQTIVLITF